MAARNPRISFAPSDELSGLLRELSELSGYTITWHVRDMLSDLIPVYRGQIDAMKKIANRPEEARQYVQALANQSTATIAQAMLALDKPKQPRKRKGALHGTT